MKLSLTPMIDLSALRDFDPEHALWRSARLAEIAQRAETYLRGRSRSEIEFAGLVINWLLDGAPDLSVPEGDAQDTSKLTLSEGSPAQQLVFCLDQVELPELSDFPHAAWPELFAVLALALLAQANEGLSHNALRFDQFRSLSDYHPEMVAGEVGPINEASLAFPYYDAIDAMEAVCIGEWLLREQDLREQIPGLVTQGVAEKRQLQASTAGLKRHEMTRQVKERFVEWYRENPARSIRDAARKFLKTLSEEEQKHFSSDNIIRTLCEAVTKSKEDPQL